MSTFEELGLKKRIIQAVEDLNFITPMPVQEKVIPHLINDEHEDIIALAQTGTGKTAAFGLPMIQKVDTSKKKTQFLIISPTRELCLQIADDIKSYAKYLDKIKVVPVFGGASIDRQISLIKKGAHIISATPGRLLDMINRRIIDIRHIDTVVLDEADEMLNMGFREDLEDILRETPTEKKTLLFSATMPKEVRKIANEYMHNPIEITIGKKNAGAENVNHICYIVQARDRYLALKRIVDYHPDIYGIVF
ncbi:MAG: DEAD/DEAH box helicase, partial [Chlorobi bacterium]|nr:DEAD/DEAH box helicase [Chlorobiota bacterium]